MGRNMERVRDMLCEELDKFGSKGELTAGSLETIDKLAHSIKSIDTIMAMEGAYSNENRGGRSYGSYRGNSRESYGSYRNSRRGRSNRGYSYDDAKEDMIDQLEDIMRTAPDKETKEAIKQAIEMIGE